MDRDQSSVRICLMFLLAFVAVCAGPAFGADLTFTLDASAGSGSAPSRAPSANPPCLQPGCVLFTGTLTDTDTDLSFIRVEDISVVFSQSSLSLDNTFFSLVPGLLSGDPNYAATGNPPNAYSGPVFGIDIAPLTPAGIYSGTVTIHASGGTGDPESNGFTISRSFTVAVTPVPQPTGGIANAASAGQATPSVVSPGSYVAIYGTALAGNGDPHATSLPLPALLNGASVTLCGTPMALLYASPTQINAIIPQAVAIGSCSLVVTAGGVPSAPVQLTVQELQPGIYTLDLTGSGAGVVANALTGQLNSTSNPAHAADFLTVYCTGLGAVQGPNGEPGPADGVAAPLNILFRTKATITATIGGIDAPVSFAGLTPTFAGLYQVNVQVPQGVPAGSSIPVSIIAAGTTLSNTVTIVVQ